MEKVTPNIVDDWNAFLAPYHQAVSEIKVKLKGIREEYRQQEKHAPIEFITGRVKTVNSIIEKMNVRQIPVDNWIEEVTDIGGIRIMCQFVEDIYETVDLLRQREDFNIVVERDYITHMKDSGYRSYHIVINYPVERIEGRRGVYIEIQIRTLAMNFWATIEHSLNYKYDGDYPDALRDRLKRAGEAAFSLDKEMSEIREDIQEAQDIFHHFRR